MDILQRFSEKEKLYISLEAKKLTFEKFRDQKLSSATSDKISYVNSYFHQTKRR